MKKKVEAGGLVVSVKLEDLGRAIQRPSNHATYLGIKGGFFPTCYLFVKCKASAPKCKI